MTAPSRTAVDLSIVITTRDDEEHVGHLVRRLTVHLQSLELRFEILVVDEGSGDNTLPLLALVKRTIPELEVIAGVDPGRGLVRGARMARGRTLLLVDARVPPPMAALSFGLLRLDDGHDVVAISGALIVRRARAWRAFDALTHRRDMDDVERRFVRRARSLGLDVHVAGPRRTVSPLERLRQALLAPLRV